MRKDPPPPLQPRLQPSRALALALVALLHGALGWLLATSVFQPAPSESIEREDILYLTPAPRPVPPAPQAQARAPNAAPRPAAPPPVPNYSFVAPMPDNAPLFAAPKNDLDRLIQGCATDRIARMMPEDRARCRFAFGQLPRTDPTADPRETLRDEAVFAAEREAAQRPGRVPCVSMFSHTIPGFSGRDNGAMVDPFCAVRELGKLTGQ